MEEICILPFPRLPPSLTDLPSTSMACSPHSPTQPVATLNLLHPKTTPSWRMLQTYLTSFFLLQSSSPTHNERPTQIGLDGCPKRGLHLSEGSARQVPSTGPKQTAFHHLNENIEFPHIVAASHLTSLPTFFIPRTLRVLTMASFQQQKGRDGVLKDITCLHPNFRHCQGRLWYPTRSSCSRFHEYPPRHDTGMFLPFPQRQASDPLHIGHNVQ